ncbi:MAG TPA: CBS domain-containing protein [Rhizomicrobium sp.]|jgi:CBS domain-containing protein|nr:CBS domain-containing protein [Rhizomicrobium sp.]
MTAAPLTINEAESVGRAAELLMQHRYVNLPVVDSSGVFIGMFGIYDLLSMLVPRMALAGDLMPNLRFVNDDPAELRTKFATVKTKPVADAVNRTATVLHPDTPEIEALRLFCRNHTTLAVVERETGKLAGIVSHWDAIGAITGNRPPHRTAT